VNLVQQRVSGGLIGLLVGDALGVPYEFAPGDAIPPASAIEFTPPAGFRRAHAGTPVGTWSDDGAQALCLLASLLECGKLDVGDFAERLLRWDEHGYMAVEGRVFDVGIQTRRAFQNLRGGATPLDAGPAEERSNGNGSLMRVLPLALWHKGSDAELVQDAYDQSRVTHGHAQSRVCCALYCLWARRLLEAHPHPWLDACATLRALIQVGSDESVALEKHIRPDEAPTGRGSGYVVDSLRSVCMVSMTSNYETAVREGIRLGDDTDTTACIAGGIVGVRDGVDAIPLRWRAALRGQELYAPLLEQLLARWK
jgi:ADP-ribosyl-[dinitrogen reductase] hydrolase